MRKQAAVALVTLLCLLTATSASRLLGQSLSLAAHAPDPNGIPRPADGARNVPLNTSIYFELTAPAESKDDRVDPESVAVEVQAAGGAPLSLLKPARKFISPASGWIRSRRAIFQQTEALAIYLEPGTALKPGTEYAVRVEARSQKGLLLPPSAGTWKFTTEPPPEVHRLNFALDLDTRPVQWHGAFFTGLCNVTFCTSADSVNPTYELMRESQKLHPRAWTYQRDFWMTGTEDRKPSLLTRLPNLVRERETRRIASIENTPAGTLLHVEDFFGHEQYGIASNRPLADDYRAGDEVLIADGERDARSKVQAVDDSAHTVLVATLAVAPEQWKLAYEGDLPRRENRDAPGLFPPGGCYLRKFQPSGTPCYYWARLDKEWDLVHGRYGRRLLVNFADAPGDLSIDGRSWTTAKDYVQWHEFVRTVTCHIIDRYGKNSLQFAWSVFNEPDLGPLFWRTSWEELQKFYDYTTDGILRAFEDRGLDSEKVFIGGLELGGIFGANLKLTEFLAHCSPTASAAGALPQNAAFADRQLDGKRSKRVESLCRDHSGKGSPCDFISIHAYNRSEMMAAKLIRAKEMALQIDRDYYRDLWVNSHESCPDWSPPPDEAAADMYLGNGYFPSWCLDVVGRQLQQAARDADYARGETLITVWPPVQNLTGLNSVTRILNCDTDGDRRADKKITVKTPVFNALAMLSDFGDRYWVLPPQSTNGREVRVFASKDEAGVVRLALVSHGAEDTQSRSDISFDVTVRIARLPFGTPARVEEYPFDKDHNSYFRFARDLRDRLTLPNQDASRKFDDALKILKGDDAAAQCQALRELGDLAPSTSMETFAAIYDLAEKSPHESVREGARKLLERAFEAGPFAENIPQSDVAELQKLVDCRPTRTETLPASPDRSLQWTARVAGNGVTFVVIRPSE